MIDSLIAPKPVLHSVLHPTDFAEGSEVALAHAIRLALAARARLEVLHAEPDNICVPISRFPDVLEMLVRWGRLPRGARRADLASLGLSVDRVLKVGEPAAASIVAEIAASHAELLVMATHGRSGFRRMLEPSVTEPAVREGRTRALVIPAGSRGFVNPADGTYDVNRILVPIDWVPDPQAAVDAAAWIARLLRLTDVCITTLHVGGPAPLVRMPDDAGWVGGSWEATGAVVDAILEVADTWSADLVVMATEGRVSPLDVLLGSTVERVLRRAKTPLLIVPGSRTRTLGVHPVAA